jgi:protein phosphatase PTC1
MALIGNITAQCEIIIATRQGIPSVGIRKTPSGPYASLRVAIFNKPLKRNEDRWIIDNHNTRYDFFGIFDGHCGSQVAEYLQKRTVNTILRNIELGHKMKRALIEAFTQIETRICLHQELLKLFGSQRQAATGSCALLVAVDKKKRIVYTANVGDSRAVLVQDNTERPLTHDHKPDSPSEMARILQAGGSVLEARDLPYCRKHQGVTKQPARYEGILAVSRTLGDYVIKLRHPGAIIAQPDIYIHPIQQHDQAIILACDGVWDVIDNATAAAHVREHTGDPLGASQALVLHAAQRGSRDDLTSIVITIEHNQ